MTSGDASAQLDDAAAFERGDSGWRPAICGATHAKRSSFKIRRSPVQTWPTQRLLITTVDIAEGTFVLRDDFGAKIREFFEKSVPGGVRMPRKSRNCDRLVSV